MSTPTTLTPNEQDDWRTVLAISAIARNFAEDLPDGMAEEISEAHNAYQENRTDDGRRDFIADVQEICADWGFPFA